MKSYANTEKYLFNVNRFIMFKGENVHVPKERSALQYTGYFILLIVW